VAARARIRITRVIAPDDLGEQLEPRMRNLGNAIGRRAQRLVPKRTFALHDSISVDTTRSGARIVTTVRAGGRRAPYWEYVEKGTSRMRAQPYLRPALLQTRSADFNNEAKINGKRGASS
jgi:HK97 gp10 family phage protein